MIFPFVRSYRRLGTLIMAVASVGLSAPTDANTLKFGTTGGLKGETEDGAFKFQVGGRVMVDGAYYDEDRRELGSGSELRRARLFVSGTLFDVWKFKGQYDFADGTAADVKDAYLQYVGFKPAAITIGQYKEPFSLEELTSSKYITFMERALPVDAFAPSRNIGIGFSTHGDAWSAAAGFFGTDFEDDSAGDGEDEGYGVAGRLTFAPWHDEGQVLHVGGAVEYRDPQDGNVRFRARPESHITTRLVDTGDPDDTGNFTDVDDITRYGIELAGVVGPFSAQAEYIRADVSDNATDDPEFNGWYVYGSFFLTGESRPYKINKGAFGRVKPSGAMGAWEIAARYSKLDLSDGVINGGEEDNITIGLNWYANRYVRFMANYIMVSADPDKDGVKDEPDVLQFRGQVDF